MMVFIRFWRNLNKKDSVESAKYEIKNVLPVLKVLERFFFMDLDHDVGSDPDFRPIRIRTQEKKSRFGFKKNRDPKHWYQVNLNHFLLCFLSSKDVQVVKN